jgi:integrase
VYGYDDITQADVTGSNLLIPHIKNNLLQPFSYATISRKFEVLMKNQFSLRKGLVFHFFRHWCCTMWARHNIYDVYTACSMMGHEDLTTTQGIYTSVSKQMNKEDIEKDLYIDNYYF